jgi:hypothetical protein
MTMYCEYCPFYIAHFGLLSLRKMTCYKVVNNVDY